MKSRFSIHRLMIAALVAISLSLSSCYNYRYMTPTQRGATNGALIGALAGGLIGSGDGNWGKGAIVGALAGGLVGGSLGYNRERRGYYGPRHYAGYR
jgi:predicted small secreted protein